ncbi:MAG: hypothetical protein LBO79_05635 [Zoogloeaceae bacterium]|jgi:hypothetical protein|nr:hypothetical protein [Zoogloeaceae bacterium]
MSDRAIFARLGGVHDGRRRPRGKPVFNDLFRHAGKHGLLDRPAVERRLAYRANRSQRPFETAIVRLERGYAQQDQTREQWRAPWSAGRV